MSQKRTVYEISREILVYCRTPRSCTAIINRCDLNSKTAKKYLEFLITKGYLSEGMDGEKNRSASTPAAGGYLSLFSLAVPEIV